MASKIILKKSSVAAKAPVAGDLDFGELAINYTDSKLYFKKADGSISSFTAESAAAVTSVGGNVGAITDTQLLTSIKNVDGAGSGLDADFLDGNHASAFYLASNPNGYTSNTGTVTSVGATTPLISSGGNTPSISIPAATASVNGYMSAAYASKLDGIAAGAQVNVATNLGITAGTTAGPIVTSSTGTNATLPTASDTASGVVTTGNQTFAGTKTFVSPITVNSTFSINGSGPGDQQNGLYVADLGGVVGTTLNPVFTTALAWQISSSRSNAISIDTSGYIYAFRSHSNAGTYTFQSKVRESDTLTTPRTLTIGATGKTFNGSTNVSWSLAEIGAQSAGNYLTTDTAQNITGEKTISGQNLLFADSGTTLRGIMGTVGGSDHWFFGGGATASNAGFLQIATGDDNGTEPIYVRQYQGGSPLTGTITRTLTLLNESGNTIFPGSISAVSKSFLIDHPTKPDMKLRHGSLEGPEHGVYVRGKVNGKIIELPEYWTKLVDPESITVQLTAIGKGQKLYVESIIENKVHIANEGLFAGEPNCFYLVQAERIDVEKMKVEI